MIKIVRIERILKANPTYKIYPNEFENELIHEEDSAKLARKFALSLGLTHSEANEIFKAVLLHDLGKFSSDGHILFSPIKSFKQAKLAREMHVDRGHALCNKYGIDGLAREVITEHHEAFSGGGYPNKKRGYELSQEVRLTSIVDAYNAMTTDRAYRQAYSPHQARKIMLYRDSWKFEESLLRDFFKFLKEEGFFDKRIHIQTVDFSAAM